MTEDFACWTCKGEGWVPGMDADPLPDGSPGEPYQVQEQCPDCGGSGTIYPGPDNTASGHEHWDDQ